MSEEFARRLILEYKGYIKELRIEHYDSSSIFIRLFRLQIAAIEKVMLDMGHTP